MVRVHSIETLGAHEGPGIRLVVFLQGCLFRCLYCHNPDSWNLTAGRQMTDDEIIHLAERERPYFRGKGGVTVSGGEPLLQRRDLIPLFTRLKQVGIHTALDTNGSVLDDDAKQLLDLTDLVLLDVKHINPELHLKLTGKSNDVTLEFAKYRNQTGKPMWLRYVLVPGYTDQPEYLHEWGKRFAGYRSVERVEILPYHTLGVYKYEQMGIPYKLTDVAPPSPEVIQRTRDIFTNYFERVLMR